jgi:hypothetical protein
MVFNLKKYGSFVRPISSALWLVGAFLVTACGGGAGSVSSSLDQNPPPPVIIEDMNGSGATNNTYTQFTATTAGATSEFRAIVVDTAIVSSISGSFDHAAGEITDGVWAGTFDAGRGVLTLVGDQTRIDLTNPANTEFLRFVQIEGDLGSGSGVAGLSTFANDMPSSAGSAVYNGVVVMSVINSDGEFALSGDAVVTANWTQDVDTVFRNLSGTLVGQSNQNVNGEIAIEGATLTDGTFSGGQVALSGTVFASTGVLAAAVEGRFFGPNADEVGGVFNLTTSADDLAIKAIFGAE